MNILMTGGTGFIGRKLVEKLVSEGHHVYVLSRQAQKHKDTSYISYISYQYPMKRLPFIHAIVNLAGESIFGYWSQSKQNKILESRINVTDKLVSLAMQMDKKPDVFLSGSAIGYYGTSDELIFTEKTTAVGTDFLAQVAESWENAAKPIEDLGIRTVYTRFGLVLDRYQGALPMMELPVNMFVGGKIASGKQWISWIHIDDCIDMLYYALTNKNIRGPLNVTAPHPRQNKDFIQLLAKTKKRPAMVPTPKFAIKLAFGDMHQLITKGQYVISNKIQDTDFTYQYPHLDDALKAIYKKA